MNHLCEAGKFKFYCLFDYQSPEEDNFLEKEFVGVRFSPPAPVFARSASFGWQAIDAAASNLRMRLF
jgi:hypothetical protein